MHHTETENRKEQIYKLLCEQKMTVLQVMRKTGYSESKIHNYLRRLHLNEHVIVEKIFERGRYLNLYRANKRNPYVKKVIIYQPSQSDLMERKIKEKNLQEQKELQEEKSQRVLIISPTTRIIRLLDAPLAPAPRTKKHVDYGIGSSFAMYDSY